ncbi:SH3 domain-containing kinase-binding protein 1-like isoform X2 [Argiope bruennichi]|uniref:SH3 domain-containing kinase-binding protein 1-like isoform X2 n=1 Tax=Argiope bruennichi TaxID=94029 RepID=UPI0024945CD8|nr:SH3 domain-containing kinase-binding protein 1-like isoform X2 [Argiope bruennichi]
MANTENKDSKKDFKKRMVKALFSYTPVNSDELTLKINDILEVIEETEEGWWKGILDGNVGMFPSNFVVELDGYAEENNKFMSEHSPSKNVAKTKNVSQQQEPSNKTGNNLLIQNKQESKSGANTSISDGIDGSNTSKSSVDPLPEKKLITTTKKPPIDSSAPRLPPKPVREQARVIFPYEAQNEDELNLKEGDIITVLSKEIEDKGWWRGELNSKIGVFPDNFVKLIKAEEKKPERPDKPPAVSASKNNLKSVTPDKSASESSPKLDKKILKTPPAKPPPPEVHKKESERPLPPCPLKKPQPPIQPVKKPTRSSLGPKLPASPAVTSVKPSAENSPSISSSFLSSLEKTEEITKLEGPVEKEKLRTEETEFDLIESSGKKLVHLTANRAKAPNRRPPSFIFLKENERDSKTSLTDCRRLSEPLLAEFSAILPLNESQKKSAVSASNVEIKPKIPPSRPSPPIAKSNSLSKQDASVSKDNKRDCWNEDSVRAQDTNKRELVSEKVPISTKEILQPKVSELTSQIDSKSPFFKIPSNIGSSTSDLPSQIIPKVPAVKIPSNISTKASSNTVSVISPNAPNEAIPSKPSHHIVTKPPATVPAEIASNFSGTTSLETQVHDIKDDLKVVINNMVTKNEYNALLKQVDELKAILETYNKNCNKAICDLKEELSEERRLRSMIELELQKLKECQKT